MHVALAAFAAAGNDHLLAMLQYHEIGAGVGALPINVNGDVLLRQGEVDMAQRDILAVVRVHFVYRMVTPLIILTSVNWEVPQVP